MADPNIDVHARPVTTVSDAAQLWFNRGLIWCYAFYHDAAVEAFDQALEADPACAMAHWGRAYARGPNYNLPWDKQDQAMQRSALAQARASVEAAQATGVALRPEEEALIDALAQRFPQREPADIDQMRGWNDAFAQAMRVVHDRFPKDLDIRALYVEAMMNRTPWRLWDQATGLPAPHADTLHCRALLEEAFEDDPKAMAHPGITHLYVHLMEMSPEPEAALRAADVLRTRVPGAGHLIHMPTHIDIQVGAYQDVLHWNRAAIDADKRAMAGRDGPSLYTGYFIHNYHFAVYGAMFLGQFQPAWDLAQELREAVPESLLRIVSPPFADFLESYLSVWVHVMVRFGKWEQIVAEPMPQDPALYANLAATLRYAKGVAHAALGHVAEAEAEQALFLEAKQKVPVKRRLHNVLCSEQLAVAEAMLMGEILYRKGEHEAAFEALRRAVALEDALPYDEPWGWMQPVRHALGALLLEQGQVEQAEGVYREDLGLGGTLTRAQVHPDNVWALRGLFACLEARGAVQSVEGRLIAQKLAIAQARADGPVTASCFCARDG